MSNTTSRYVLAAGFDAFLAQNGALIQKKSDPRGGEMPEEASNQFAIAAWADLVDDALVALMKSTIVALSNLQTPIITGFCTANGGTIDFEVPALFNVGLLTFLRVVALEGSVGGKIQAWSDPGRTKLVYEHDFVTNTIPPVAAAGMSDRNSATIIADDGTGLQGGQIYLRITNDGIVDSRYQLQIILQGVPTDAI